MKRKLNTEVDREMVISYIKRLDITKTYTVEVLQKKVRRTIPPKCPVLVMVDMYSL